MQGQVTVKSRDTLCLYLFIQHIITGIEEENIYTYISYIENRISDKARFYYYNKFLLRNLSLPQVTNIDKRS